VKPPPPYGADGAGSGESGLRKEVQLGGVCGAGEDQKFVAAGLGVRRGRLPQGAGEQQLILAFDAPETIGTLVVEIDEPDTGRTQEMTLSVSTDGGRTYRELLRQEYTFSPPGTSREHEEWSVKASGVSHLQLRIKPDKGGKACRATLTTLALE